MYLTYVARALSFSPSALSMVSTRRSSRIALKRKPSIPSQENVHVHDPTEDDFNPGHRPGKKSRPSGRVTRGKRTHILELVPTEILIQVC
jgi:hypothetical protein